MGKKSKKGNNNKKKGGSAVAGGAVTAANNNNSSNQSQNSKAGVFFTTLTGKKRLVTLTEDGISQILSMERGIDDEHPDIKSFTLQVIEIIPPSPDDYNKNSNPKLVLSDGKHYYCEVEFDGGEQLLPNSIIRVKDFLSGGNNDTDVIIIYVMEFEILGHKGDGRIGRPMDIMTIEFEEEEEEEEGKLTPINDLITLNRSWNYGSSKRAKFKPLILQIIGRDDDNDTTTTFYGAYTLSDGVHYFSKVYIGKEDQLMIPNYSIIRINNFFRDEDGIKEDPSMGGVIILSYDIVNWKDKTMIGNPSEIKLHPLQYYSNNKISDPIQISTTSPSLPPSSRVSNPTNTITEGAIRKFYSMNEGTGDFTYNPILQIVELAPPRSEEGYADFWVSLSDGKHRCLGLLPSDECSEIRVNSLIKVNGVFKLENSGIAETIFGFAGIEKVGDLAEIVGNPIYIEKVSMMMDEVLFEKPEGDTAPVTKNPMGSNHENVQKALSFSTPPVMITTENEVASFTIRYESELKKMQMNKKRTNNKVQGEEGDDENDNVIETKSVKTPKSHIPFRLEILPDGNNEHRRNNGWVSFYLLCMDSCPTKTVHAIGFIRHYHCDDVNDRETHISDIPFEKTFDYVGDYWPITRMIRSTDVATHCINERGEWNIEIHFKIIQVKNTLRGFKTFYADKLSKLRSDHPNFSVAQINDTLTDIWRNLSDNEKGEWMIEPPPGFEVYFQATYQSAIERLPTTAPKGKRNLLLKRLLIQEWRDMEDDWKQSFNDLCSDPLTATSKRVLLDEIRKACPEVGEQTFEHRSDDDNFDDVTLMDLIRAIW